MKKFIIIAIIIALILFLVYRYKDTLIHSDGSGTLSQIDKEIIEAIIAEDKAKLDTLMLLETSEPSDFLSMLKFYAPEVKVHGPKDLYKLLARTRLYCERKELSEAEQYEMIAESFDSIAQEELKRTPACHDDILEFQVVHTLCTILNEDCASERYIFDSRREGAIVHRAQNVYDCMSRHMEDIQKKNRCIAETPRFDQKDLEQAMKRYCDEAVACHQFTTSSECLHKYNRFFESDKRKGKDCTNIHINAMKLEFDIINQLVEKNKCEAVQQYEQYLHVEELFDKSKTIREFSDLLMREINQPFDAMRYHQTKLDAVYEQAIEGEKDPKPGDYMVTWAHYNACRMGQMPPK